LLTRITMIVLLLLSVGGGKQQGFPDDFDLDAVRYPLEAFDLTEHEMVIVSRARYVMTQQCAKQLEAELPPLPTGRMRMPRGDRYGLASRQTAWEWGYSQDKPPERVVPWELEVQQDAHLSQLLVGCLDATNRALAQHADELLRDLDDEAWQASRETAVVQQKARMWQDCNGKAGLHYDTQVETPYFDWGEKRIADHGKLTEQDRRDGLRPDDTERRAALVDVNCKQRTGFLRVWAEADVAAQRDRLTAGHGTRLQSVVTRT
jgi:hypothetical protein